MALYKQQVQERRIYDVTYYVEADSPEEAKEKAQSGDSVKEENERLLEVGDRDAMDEPVKMSKEFEKKLRKAWGL